MSPTAREVVANKPLSGAEVRELIRADVEKLLDAEGLLSFYMAYGRIGWTLTLALHLDNPVRPESVTEIVSKKAAVNQPAIAAVESSPLDNPSDDSVASGTTLTRNVTSPNTERIRAGLPITLDVRQQDGTVSQQQASYPPDATLGDGDVSIRDTSADAKSRWGIKETITRVADKVAGV